MKRFILEGTSNTIGTNCLGTRKNDEVLKLLFTLNLWRTLDFVQWPIGRVIAFLLLLGKPLQHIYLEVQRCQRRVLGWLLSPARHPKLRRLGGDVLQIRHWHLVVAGAIAVTAVGKAFKKWRDARDPVCQKKRNLQLAMEKAGTYGEWVVTAKKLDELEGIDRTNRWRSETRLYDRKLLEKRLHHLQEVRQGGDIGEMMFSLRADLIRNLGNITNSELHERFPVVPEPILRYIEEVKAFLHAVTNYSGADLSTEEKLNYLRETRHAFGRTALVLSGGGGLGAFHLGVVKALLDHKLLPRILSGSSVGSIVCAILGTYKDDELRDMFSKLHEFEMTFFSNSTATEFFRHLLFKGTLHDHEVLQSRLRKLYGDLTFQEAYQRTGRILNVSVTAADTHEPPRLLNYLTAPHVLIWSAVACSSAFPYLYAPQDLWARNQKGDVVRYSAEPGQRRWRDGSLEEDLPMRGLSEMFNVNYYLVSQTNPHIVPLMNLKKKLPRTVYNLLETEFKHRCTQLSALLPSPGLRYMLKLFNQPWEGDITMLLPSSYNELRRAICNPSKEDLDLAIHQGQLAAFAKLSAIQCNCAIEMTLDECLAQVSAELHGKHKEKNKGLRRVHPRIPSWVNLKSLGLPCVSSSESIENHHSERNGSANHLVGISSRFQPISEHDSADSETHSTASPEGEDYAAAEYSGVLDSFPDTDYPGWMPFDCCDRSADVWETLLPLVASSTLVGNQGLDVIAP